MDELAWTHIGYEVIRKGRKLVLRRRVEEYCLEAEDHAPIIEIRSGAIVPDPIMEGAYLIEANTAYGLRKFANAIEMHRGDPQSDGETAQVSYGQVWRLPVSSSTTFLPWTTVAWTGTSTVSTRTVLERREEFAPQALLNELRSNRNPQRRRQLVLESEPITFDAGQTEDLRVLLRQFVEENRDSNSAEDLVAVGSAIRKYVGILGSDQLGEISLILESGHRAPVAPEVELEVAKMIVRKLTVNPPPQPNFLPEMANQLADLARTYLNPRLLPRQYHAATALNSTLALALLRSDLLLDVCVILRSIRAPWFKQLVVRRALEIGRVLASHVPDASRAHQEALEEVVRASREEHH